MIASLQLRVFAVFAAVHLAVDPATSFTVSGPPTVSVGRHADFRHRIAHRLDAGCAE